MIPLPGEIRNLARMDRQLVEALEKALQEENERRLEADILRDELLTSMAKLERLNDHAQ